MKKYLSGLLVIILLLHSFISISQSNTPTVTIANWQGNKNAALCVTLDDGCEQQFTVAKQTMDSLGIKGTFFIITDLDYNCDGGPNSSPPMAIYNGKGSPQYWGNLQDAINTGHEIAAHTVHHPDLDTVFKYYYIDSVAKEIYMSKAALESELYAAGQSNTPYKVLTFAYPYGSGQSNTTIIDTIQKYFIAARGAGTATYTHTWDIYDDAKNQTAEGFINYYYQVESYACTDTLDINWFNDMLDSTITYSGWFNAMYHNIDGSSLENDEYSVSSNNFRAQLKAIIAKQDKLWIAPFKDVVRYSKENVSAKVNVKSCKSDSTVISLTDTIKSTDFNVPLTLIVSNFSCTCSLDSIKQAGNFLTFTTPTTTQIMFNAVPNAGDITIYTGTSNVTALVAPSIDDYFELYQNIPNPSSSTTAISYNLKQGGAVTLELFDMNGTTAKTLVSEEQTAGKYCFSVNTESFQAGIYFYRLTSGNAFDVKKMVVIR